jgi:hypothetical protein
MNKRGKISNTRGTIRKGLPWSILTFTCQVTLLILDYLQFRTARSQVKKLNSDDKHKSLQVAKLNRRKHIVKA